MTKKTKSELGEQQKQLYEWAEEGLRSDDVPQFLSFCRQSMHEPTDVISYTEFLTLKEEFES